MNEILSFFILTFGVTYAIGLPVAAASQGYLPVNLPRMLIFLSLFGPSLAAVILTGRKRGWPGVRQLLAGLLLWRIPAVWYFIVLLLPTTISFITLLIFELFTGGRLEFPAPLPVEIRQAGSIGYFILPTFWLLQSMGEEIGWRGYVLPRLLARQSPLVASLILGAIWGAWHLPLFLMQGSAQSQIPFGWYLLYTISLAILFTWLYIQTGGNLLTVILSHAAIQPATIFIPILPSIAAGTLPFLIYIMVTALIALFIVIGSRWTKTDPLTTERMGK